MAKGTFSLRSLMVYVTMLCVAMALGRPWKLSWFYRPTSSERQVAIWVRPLIGPEWTVQKYKFNNAWMVGYREYVPGGYALLIHDDDGWRVQK